MHWDCYYCCSCNLVLLAGCNLELVKHDSLALVPDSSYQARHSCWAGHVAGMVYLGNSYCSYDVLALILVLPGSCSKNLDSPYLRMRDNSERKAFAVPVGHSVALGVSFLVADNPGLLHTGRRDGTRLDYNHWEYCGHWTWSHG